MCASIPATKPFFIRYLPVILGTKLHGGPSVYLHDAKAARLGSISTARARRSHLPLSDSSSASLSSTLPLQRPGDRLSPQMMSPVSKTTTLPDLNKPLPQIYNREKTMSGSFFDFDEDTERQSLNPGKPPRELSSVDMAERGQSRFTIPLALDLGEQYGPNAYRVHPLYQRPVGGTMI